MDAATTDTYRTFRPNRKGGSVFDHVIENMRRFAAVKKGALGYSFLVMVRRDEGKAAVSNHHEVLAAAKLAKSIGCDYFEVKAMFDEGHHIVGLAEEVLDSIGDQLEQARCLEGPDFEIVNSSTLDSLRDQVGPVQPKDYHRCRVAELRTLVIWGLYLSLSPWELDGHARGRGHRKSDRHLGSVRSGHHRPKSGLHLSLRPAHVKP